MGGCCAPNCTNNSKEGKRCFVFLRNSERRAKWLQMCRRDKWQPTLYSTLCEVHFEESQFETSRADGWKKLKPNAVPTLFNVSNFPKQLTPKWRILQRSILAEVSCGLDLNSEGTSQATSTEKVSCGLDLNSEGTSQATSTEKEEELTNKIKVLERRLWSRQKALQKTRSQLRQLRKNIASLPFLKPAQLDILTNGKRKIIWTPEMLKEALQLRFAVGWKGYKVLVKKGYPFPSYSTICRKLQNIDFAPGILTDVLPLLESRGKIFTTSLQKDCVLLVDEMEIDNGICFDKASSSFFGHVTLNDRSQNIIGSQLFVVMIRGANSNWKQVIAYHITDKATQSDYLYQFINDCVKAVETIGFHVIGIVSDMGPKNQGIWRSYGVKVGRYSEVSYVPHPARDDSRLHFFPDVPHLLKNLRSALLGHNFEIPQSIANENGLPTTAVSARYLHSLNNIQKMKDLKLAPEINDRTLNPGQFDKMKVKLAHNIFSHQTVTALETLVKLDQLPSSALTTAWFLTQVRNWFNIMNLRRHQGAITQKTKIQKVHELYKFKDLMEGIKIGVGNWKPVQTGVVMSILNIVEVIEYLFSKGYKAVLTSRFNQDALESLFSTIRRHGNINPSALQAQRALKLVVVTQFMSETTGSENYSGDEADHLINFFNCKPTKQQQTHSEEQCCAVSNVVLSDSSDEGHALDVVSCNTIQYLLGCSVNAVLKEKLVCEQCTSLIMSDNPTNEENTLICSRELGSSQSLKIPSHVLHTLIVSSERVLEKRLKKCARHKRLLPHLIYVIKQKVDFSVLNTCLCKISDKVLESYVVRRLRGKKERLYKNERQIIAQKVHTFLLSPLLYSYIYHVLFEVSVFGSCL